MKAWQLPGFQPFGANMNFLKWIRDLFHRERLPPENWKLVKTITVDVERTAYNKKESGSVYYHLHESDRDARKLVITSTIEIEDLEKKAKHLADYHTTVYPWLHGRYVKGIPSYNDVDSIDVQTRLSE
jgi:hypothetical protein